MGKKRKEKIKEGRGPTAKEPGRNQVLKHLPYRMLRKTKMSSKPKQISKSYDSWRKALSCVFFFIIKDLLIYLRKRERRERERAQAKGEGEAGAPLSREPSAGLDPKTPAKGRCSTGRATGAPKIRLK